ncbi:helix-turn-helix domain-containing protein [Streptomyces olivoreticuli]
MSTEAMKWAIEQAPPMPAQLVATLAGLANHADAKGRGAYPSLAKLAAYTCKAERSVRRDLRQLEDLGLIRHGDPAKVAHLPPDRRPEVYDLAMERVVPGGRAGADEGTRTSARTLASTRARGGKKKASSDAYRGDAHVRGDAHIRADVDVTNGGTPTSQRGDAHVTTGGTPTSAKPSVEPSENRQVKREPHAAPAPAGLVASLPRPDGRTRIDEADFHLTDAMRRWAVATFGTALDVDYETDQFVSHHRAQGERRRSWPDEWQKWLRRSAKYASERANRPQPTPGGSVVPFRERQQQAADDMFDRAMARAQARMHNRETS